MLKRMMIKKIMVATSIVLVMLMLYLIPSNKEEIDLNKKQKLEYVYPNDLEAIYLLDKNNYLSMAKIGVNNKNEVSKAMDLIDGLTINGKKKDIIPNGFKSLLPENTKVLNIKLDKGILTIDFSGEFKNVPKEDEKKVIESLAYTLTSINGIDKIEIYVDGRKLTNLPNSKIKLPDYLDKKYGINKQYEFTNLSDIDSYTVYYVFNDNNNVYYTPVTKYVNNQKQDKVKIIIDELATSLLYESNLMSYLDANVKLINYELNDKTIRLNFNELILSDIANNLILEEVMYTIGLSLTQELDIDEVIFEVNNREISTFSLKSLD